MALTHKIYTQPVVEPVTLAEMRAHIGITQSVDTARDAVITTRITAARTWCEDECRRAFITQTWRAYDELFPGLPSLVIVAITSPVSRFFTLRGDVQSVSSIKYLDDNGAQQTLDPSKYYLDDVNGRVYPSFGNDWPSCRQQAKSVQIEYICGYGDTAATVPEPIKEAIRFIVSQWEVFQSSIEGNIRPFTIPAAARQLLDHYVDYRRGL